MASRSRRESYDAQESNQAARDYRRIARPDLGVAGDYRCTHALASIQEQPDVDD
jgi:hypothetical protein